MTKGCMIVCDGGNGAGKSTIIRHIEAHLKSLDRDYIMTREPGGTPIGEKIRSVILAADTPEMCDVTELMLFAAARAQHVYEKIIPAINDGKVVVSDRFDSATVSFQHYGRGLSIDLIQQLNAIALDGFSPDITIILDIEPKLGLERVLSRGEGLDRIEMANLDFLTKTRNGYLAQAEENPDKFSVIDASQPLEVVIDQVLKVVDRVLTAGMNKTRKM